MLMGLEEYKDLNIDISLLKTIKYISKYSSILTTNLTHFITLFMSNFEFQKTFPLYQSLIKILMYLNNQDPYLIY